MGDIAMESELDGMVLGDAVVLSERLGDYEPTTQEIREYKRWLLESVSWW